ncbi:Hypothetical protein A7982_06247 [Minicystis rosea]|nr:Hypothetical protein A7982_06247 [Minicystis rosea]
MLHPSMKAVTNGLAIVDPRGGSCRTGSTTRHALAMGAAPRYGTRHREIQCEAVVATEAR